MESLQRCTTLVGIVTITVLVGLAGFTSLSKAQGGGTTTRISVASDGTEGNIGSYNPSISTDARYVAFYSGATNLVEDDTNNVEDVFVHDRQTGQTTRVSVASDGTEGNNDSYTYLGSISADGRYVAIRSEASNLVTNDTNNQDDIFVYDRQTEQIVRVSVASDGTQANGASYYFSISADGRYVGIFSTASNLVANDTNNHGDVFVHDRQTGQITRVSIASNGTQGDSESLNPSISSDGRYIAFPSYATNLVANDTNLALDVFVHDQQTGQTTRVSIASDGTQGNNSSDSPSISADGRFVSFHSNATNLISGDTNGVKDVFVHDRQTGQTTRISIASDGTQGNNDSDTSSISADGRYVAFLSYADNLIFGDTNLARDVFVNDRQTSETSRVSIASNGIQGNTNSYYPSNLVDGNYIGFFSFASNLVLGDTNGVADVFLRDMGQQPTPTPTITPSPSNTSTVTNTPPPGTTLTPTATRTSTPTITMTPTMGPSPTATRTVTPVITTTPSSATVTPTATSTQPTPDGAVYIPLVLRQYAFATPPPATPTPTATPPTCEEFDHEPNNLFENADNNLPLCEGQTVSGSVSRINDVRDLYRIELNAPLTVQIALTNLPVGADYDLYLDAGPGNNLAYSTTAGSVNEIITFSLAPGRYYIRIIATEDGNPNRYQLRWSRE